MMKNSIVKILFCLICLANVNTAFASVTDYFFRPEPISYAECERIKDQYGIPLCTVEEDYWVGAVVACGGVDNMPTFMDFSNISDKILGDMIYRYDTQYFSNYYLGMSNYYVYSNEPYQKNAVNNKANWVAKKWQNWRYSVDYDDVHGYTLAIDDKYANVQQLYKLNKDYDDYVEKERREVYEWNQQHPDDKKTFSVDSRYDYMKKAIGEYSSRRLSRNNNLDLSVYAICRNNLLK